MHQGVFVTPRPEFPSLQHCRTCQRWRPFADMPCTTVLCSSGAGSWCGLSPQHIEKEQHPLWYNFPLVFGVPLTQLSLFLQNTFPNLYHGWPPQQSWVPIQWPRSVHRALIGYDSVSSTQTPLYKYDYEEYYTEKNAFVFLQNSFFHYQWEKRLKLPIVLWNKTEILFGQSLLKNFDYSLL